MAAYREKQNNGNNIPSNVEQEETNNKSSTKDRRVIRRPGKRWLTMLTGQAKPQFLK